jgi:hypothetical protein
MARGKLIYIRIHDLPISKIGNPKWVWQSVKNGFNIAFFGQKTRKCAKRAGHAAFNRPNFEMLTRQLKRMTDKKHVFFGGY